eukprot:17090-Heterococcus_DN1.PRE.1
MTTQISSVEEALQRAKPHQLIITTSHGHQTDDDRAIIISASDLANLYGLNDQCDLHDSFFFAKFHKDTGMRPGGCRTHCGNSEFQVTAQPDRAS